MYKSKCSQVVFLLTVVILLPLANISCSQNRTYLTEQEKAWNPYKQRQVLVFGTTDGRRDTLTITMAEANRFPDGIGALRELMILKLHENQLK